MIYFLTPREGGNFIRIERKKSIQPRELVAMLQDEKYIAVFKCGMIWDSFILPYLKSGWRHKAVGGRREGKKYYKYLLTLDLPTEYIR